MAFTESSEEHIKKIGIETIRQLCIANIQICVWSGGLKMLIEAATDPALADISESIVISLLFILNEP